MKVTHLFHSGVLLEDEQHLFLFDYYGGHLELDQNKPLYIFSSHSHYDHFSKKIFKIMHPSITYIFSSDCKSDCPHISLAPHQERIIDDFKVSTLFSSDAGVAFILEVSSKIIFFSGDLHYWKWKEESQKDNDYQKDVFIREINLLPRDLYLSFVVVDSRLEENTFLGLDYFMKHTHSEYIMPIHYSGDYQTSNLVKQHITRSSTQFLLPTKRNETFII